MQLKVYITEWAIHDGNCQHFSKGHFYNFALVACKKPLHPKATIITEGQPGIKAVAHSAEYNVTAEIVHITEDEKIYADCGFGFLMEYPVTNETFKAGDLITGIMEFDVGSYTYFKFAKDEAATPSVYTWKVDKVERVIADWIHDGETYTESYLEVPSTNESSFSKNAYLLTVTRADDVPEKEKQPAGSIAL